MPTKTKSPSTRTSIVTDKHGKPLSRPIQRIVANVHREAHSEQRRFVNFVVTKHGPVLTTAQAEEVLMLGSYYRDQSEQHFKDLKVPLTIAKAKPLVEGFLKKEKAEGHYRGPVTIRFA